MLQYNIASVSMNSLTYKCLAALAAAAASPTTSTTITTTATTTTTGTTNITSSATTPSPSTASSSTKTTTNSSLSTSPSSPPISTTTTSPSSFASNISSAPKSESYEHFPIDVVQYIIDHAAQERIPISGQYLCSLLSGGGCYSIDLWKLCFYNQFKEADIIKILSTLAKNCYNLRRLTLGGHTWIYKSRVVQGPMRSIFRGNTLIKLRSLKLQQTSSPEELITIFSACPNLVKLEICQPSLTDKQINIVAKELQQTAYSKIRYSLRALCLPSSVHRAGIIKMVALFPNLAYLNCCHYEDVLEAIENGMMEMDVNYIDDDEYNDFNVNELRKTKSILAKLQGITVTHPMGRNAVTSLVALSHNLQELVLEVDAHMVLHSIANLKYLKRLALHNSQSSPASFLQQVLPILQQIGDNLEALDLEGFDVVDLSTCARYCPNLRHFSGQWFTILSCTQSNPGLIISKKEEANLRRPFSHLQSLRLRPRSQRNIGVKAIGYILTNAINIESIELYSCPDLTDEQLIELIKNNSLRNLRSLILRHGHLLSKSCLNRLVHSLDELSFLDCGAPLLSKAELH
ncbi:uncharacterized protein LOC107363392 [Tetranychus urticae]|uniref:Uncharacterized protein n=1 Tax=Tetranychus urticae TaxID=32264 RepID=T1KFS4_TETUR|nr:uncharacterized protein LOC107363392 [Tetranychus urticae]